MLTEQVILEAIRNSARSYQLIGVPASVIVMNTETAFMLFDAFPELARHEAGQMTFAGLRLELTEDLIGKQFAIH